MPQPKSNGQRKLVSVPGGKSSAVGELLSGKVPRAKRAPRKKKAEVPAQELPSSIAKIANLFAAARTIKKEIESKEKYSMSRLGDFCLHDFVHRAVLSERRPGSVDYASEYSKFKFVLTSRTTLTPEKEEALKDMRIPLSDHTRLAGIEINYQAIKAHGLENKLREALEAMDVDSSVLDECFRPKVELKDAFYDRLTELVSGSLDEGEKLEEKVYEVLRILQPTTQLRNVDVIGLSQQECFDLIMKTEIEAEEQIA